MLWTITFNAARLKNFLGIFIFSSHVPFIYRTSSLFLLQESAESQAYPPCLDLYHHHTSDSLQRPLSHSSPMIINAFYIRPPVIQTYPANMHPWCTCTLGSGLHSVDLDTGMKSRVFKGPTADQQYAHTLAGHPYWRSTQAS